MIKDGSKMINAVTNSTVPHLTINMAASYGAGNYGMCGRAYGPRFLFTWPNAKTAVMGPQQLAGVMSIVARQSAASMGRPFDEDADAAMRAAVEEQIERESLAMFMTGRLYDDGIIDPATPAPCSASASPSCHTSRGPRPARLRRFRHVMGAGACTVDRDRAVLIANRGEIACASPAPAAASGSAPSPCSATPMPRPSTSRPATPPSTCPAPLPPTPTCGPTCSSTPPAAPAPTPCTPATASWPSRPTSPGPSAAPA